MLLAEHLFKNLSVEKKLECLHEIIRLNRQLVNGLGLGKTYYLLLDNDVLNALSKPNSQSIRYISLIVTFIVLKRINLNIKLLINPVIFYEFNGEEAFNTEIEFNNAMNELTKLLLKLEVEVFVSDMKTFKEAKKNFKSIKHDIKIIHSAIKKIKSSDFSLNLDNSNPNYLFTPIIANKISPKISTKFFQSHKVQKFIDSLVQSKIMHNKENSKNSKILRHKETLELSRLLKLKKNKLKGIGDLSLLSFCNMNEQFYNSSDIITIAISFDELLEKNLKNHSTITACERIDFSNSREKIDKQLKNMEDIQQEFNYKDNEVEKFSLSFKNELLKVEWIKSISSNYDEFYNKNINKS